MSSKKDAFLINAYCSMWHARDESNIKSLSERAMSLQSFEQAELYKLR